MDAWSFGAGWRGDAPESSELQGLLCVCRQRVQTRGAGIRGEHPHFGGEISLKRKRAILSTPGGRRRKISIEILLIGAKEQRSKGAKEQRSKGAKEQRSKPVTLTQRNFSKEQLLQK